MTAELLLIDPSANLRYLVLTELFVFDSFVSEVNELKELLFDDPKIKTLIDNQQPDGSWNPGILYGSEHRTIFQVTCDAVKRLGYLGLDKNHDTILKASEYIFSRQEDDGSWDRTVDQKIDGHLGGYEYIPITTALPLKALASVGLSEDKRSKKAYNWLLEKQLPDGAWPTGVAGGGVYGYRAGYRKLPQSKYGCRSTTTAVVASLAFNQKLCNSEEAKKGISHLLSCRTQDKKTLGFEVARTLGFEPTTGRLTYHAKLDQALILDLAWRVGVSNDDKRIKELVEFISHSFNTFGMIKYRGNNNASRWVTFDILRALKKLEFHEDWVSRDIEIPFQRYLKPRRRF